MSSDQRFHSSPARATGAHCGLTAPGARPRRPGLCRLLLEHNRAESSGRLVRLCGTLLVAVVLAFVELTLPGAGTVRPAAARPSSQRQSLDGMAREVVYLVNLERTQNRLPPLKVNARLVRDARLQAAQIASIGVLDHVILGGPYPTPTARAEAAGYDWNALGENLAWGYDDAHSAVVAWMRSPGHRANILGGSFTETGVVLTPGAQGRLIFVQTFGNPE
jgi:uncharacterized protein YkwD